jgi:cell division protease FtsH
LLTSEPAIGFLDELDALPDRATLDNRAREWWTTIITLCLTEIDRVKKSGKKVMLLGATNYFSRLDAALVRPGRLEQRVRVLPPQSEDEVVALLGYYLGDDIAVTSLHTIAHLALGATPASVEGWVKAARAQARAHDRALDLADIIGQMAPADTRSPHDTYAIALHEIGHAIVALELGHTVETVSIIPSTSSEGETRTVKPSTLVTHDHLEDLVTIILAGRAADIVLGDGPNAGAEGDLAMATETLLAGYERQGLGEQLAYGPVLDRGCTDTRDRIENTLKRLLHRAESIVDANREEVLILVDRLVVTRVMSGRDVQTLLKRDRGNSAGIGIPPHAGEDTVIEANPR